MTLNKIIITAAAVIITAVAVSFIIKPLFLKEAKMISLDGMSGYKVVLTSSMSGSSRSYTSDILMYVKSIEKKGDNTVLYFLIHSVDFNNGINKLYNALIPVIVGENGSIVRIDYPLSMEKEYEEAGKNIYQYTPLKTLFTYMIYAVEPVINKSMNKYENITYIPNGYIKSSYEIKKNHIQKTRTYIEDGSAVFDIELSDISINLSKDFWVKSIASHEILSLNSGSRVDNTISISEIPFDNKFDKYFKISYDEISAEYRKENYSFYDQQRNMMSTIKSYDEGTKNKLNKEFNEKFSNLNDNSNESYFAMKSLLENNPYLIMQVPKKIKSVGANDNDAARMMIGILEKIGSADAQGALSAIMKDGETTETNRIRAVVALNGVEKPSDYAVDTLINQASIRESKDDDFIANTSLLALGSAGSKLMDKTEKYDEIRSYFEKSLNSDVQPKRQTLLSIGNTADKFFYDKVTPYLHDNSPENRAAAVYAAAAINMNQFMKNAESFLAEEKEGSVRSQVYQSFASSRNPSSQMTDIVTENYFKETKQAQNSMIKYLKNNINDKKSADFLYSLLNSEAVSPAEKIEIRQLLRNR